MSSLRPEAWQRPQVIISLIREQTKVRHGDAALHGNYALQDATASMADQAELHSNEIKQSAVCGTF